MKSVTAVTPVAFSRLKERRRRNWDTCHSFKSKIKCFADIPLQIMVTCVVRASLYFFFLYFCICNCCAWLGDMAWPSLVTSDAQGSLCFSGGKLRSHYFTTTAFCHQPQLKHFQHWHWTDNTFFKILKSWLVLEIAANMELGRSPP